MSLQIPSFPNPADPTTPWANAYGWISGLTLSLREGMGSVRLDIHPSEAAWQGQPAVVQLVTGRDLPPLAALLSDPAFAQAFATIQAKLEAALIAGVPALAGATQSQG